jgi:hypothetical protein
MSKKPSIHDWVWDEGDPEEIWYLEEEIAAGVNHVQSDSFGSQIGAFGTVYKAIHNETGQVAALKITKPEESGEATIPDVVELYILKNCSHKNIVKLFGTWTKACFCSSLSFLLCRFVCLFSYFWFTVVVLWCVQSEE